MLSRALYAALAPLGVREDTGYAPPATLLAFDVGTEFVVVSIEPWLYNYLSRSRALVAEPEETDRLLIVRLARAGFSARAIEGLLAVGSEKALQAALDEAQR